MSIEVRFENRFSMGSYMQVYATRSTNKKKKQITMGEKKILQLKEILERINFSISFIDLWTLYINIPLFNEFRGRNIKNQGKIKKDTYIVFLCDNIF